MTLLLTKGLEGAHESSYLVQVQLSPTGDVGLEMFLVLVNLGSGKVVALLKLNPAKCARKKGCLYDVGFPSVCYEYQ